MPEFTQSWAFVFIIGCFVGGAIGFLLAIIFAASGMASRMEERIEDSLIYEVGEREKKRRGGCPDIEMARQNNPRTD